MNHHPLWTATRPYLYVALSRAPARVCARTRERRPSLSRLARLGLASREERKRNVVKLGHPGDISRRCNATRKRETRASAAREKRISTGGTFRRAKSPAFRNVTAEHHRPLRAYHPDLYLLKESLPPMVPAASYRIPCAPREKRGRILDAYRVSLRPPKLLNHISIIQESKTQGDIFSRINGVRRITREAR